MSDASAESSAKVLAAFRSLHARDVAIGAERSLVEYQALFAGRDQLIAEEFERLRAPSNERPATDRDTCDPPPMPYELGPYEILGELGRGAQGIVYLARDRRLGRSVAVKVLAEFSRGGLKRFQREAEVASRLSHPGICTIYDSGLADGHYFIAMRHVDGEPLSACLHRARFDRRADSSRGVVRLPSGRETDDSTPRLELTRILWFFERCARALHMAHEAGLIHRDIKPGNVMVTRDGDPVLLDFGLARELHSDLTTRSVAVGTPEYMSPEQLDPGLGPNLDRRTDVYSLGVSLYECVTLRRPFQASSWAEQYQKILSSEFPNPSRLNPLVDRDLRAVLEKALERDRSHRYATAEEFADDLRRIRSNETVHARPSGPIRRALKWSRRNPLLAAAAACLCLLVLAQIAALIALQHTRNRERELGADLARKATADRERNWREAHAAMATARLATRNGDWRTAHAAYERARELGYPDATEVALGRVEAFVGQGDDEAVRRILRELGSGRGSPHEARILLLSGDAPPGLATPPEHGLEPVRRALELGGLEPADLAFARSLLADSIGEARDRIREALALDRYHRRANQVHCILLLNSGRLEEASSVAATYAALFPGDPMGGVLSAATSHLLHGVASPPRSPSDIAPETVEQLRGFVATFGLFETLEGELLRAMAGEDVDVGLLAPSLHAAASAGPVGDGDGALARFLAATLPHVAPSIVAGLDHGRRLFDCRMPLAVANAWWTMSAVFQRLIQGRSTAAEIDQSMTQAIRYLDDGVFLLIRGHARLVVGRTAESADDYARAATTASLFRIRRSALLLAAHTYARVARANRAGSGPGAAQARQAARERLVELIADDGASPATLRFAADTALALGDVDLGLEACDEWTRRAVDDVDAWTRMAELAHRKGHLFRARELANAALELTPEHRAARECLSRIDADLATRIR